MLTRMFHSIKILYTRSIFQLFFITYLYPSLPVNHSVLNSYKFGIYTFTTVRCGMAWRQLLYHYDSFLRPLHAKSVLPSNHPSVVLDCTKKSKVMHKIKFPNDIRCGFLKLICKLLIHLWPYMDCNPSPIIQINVRFSLCMPSRHWKNGFIAPFILNHGTRWVTGQPHP
jgi:hypothetical protein